MMCVCVITRMRVYSFKTEIISSLWVTFVWSNFKESKEVFLIFPPFSVITMYYIYVNSGIIRIMMYNFVESMKLTTYANIVLQKRKEIDSRKINKLLEK